MLDTPTHPHVSPRWPLVLGPVLFAIIALSGVPADLAAPARYTLAITAWMAVWWVSDAVPMAVTALLPTLLFPMLGILDEKSTAKAYAHPMLFLFLGGSPSRVLLGFIVATAALSAWISNTATTVMMAPLAIATAAYLGADERGRPAALPLLLGVAYSASIGGLATLIGTPTNGIFASLVSERYGQQFGFAEWLGIGFPVVALLLCALYFYLAYVSGLMRRSAGDGLEQVRAAYDRLGAMTRAERQVAAVFATMALAWSARPLYADVLPLTDAGIAILGATVLFVLPGSGERGRLLDWPTARTVPWGVLVLFAGGLALAAGFSESGLAAYLGGKLTAIGTLPLLLVLLIVVGFVNFLTEVTSNVATAAALLPIVAEMAEQSGLDPVALMAAATLAASCAFMLPVATAPNAIVFGSGHLTVGYMARRGFVLNLISVVVIAVWTWMRAQ